MLFPVTIASFNRYHYGLLESERVRELEESGYKYNSTKLSQFGRAYHAYGDDWYAYSQAEFNVMMPCSCSEGLLSAVLVQVIQGRHHGRKERQASSSRRRFPGVEEIN